MAASDQPISAIPGSPDDMKFRSSMTLLDASSTHEIFAEAIGTLYPDGEDCNAFRRPRHHREVNRNHVSEQRSTGETSNRPQLIFVPPDQPERLNLARRRQLELACGWQNLTSTSRNRNRTTGTHPLERRWWPGQRAT
jgi:hypothetical protein